MRNFKLLLFLLLIASPAYAQQTVITKPYVAPNSTIGSGSIATTDLFQSVFAQNASRASCLVQNKSSLNTMWVYFGARTSATKDLSIKLSPGSGVSCSVGSVVLKDEISVTGTSADLFYAGQQ